MKLCKNCGANVYDIQTVCHECNSPIETKSKSTLANNEGKTSYTSPSSFDSYHTYDVPNGYHDPYSNATGRPTYTAPKSLDERILALDPWKKILIIGAIIIIIIVVAALLLRKPARSDAPYAQPLYKLEDACNAGDFQMMLDTMPDVPAENSEEYNYVVKIIEDAYKEELDKMKNYETTIELNNATRLSETELLFYVNSNGLNPITTTDGYHLEAKIRMQKGLHVDSGELNAVTLEINGEWYLVDFEVIED